MKGWVAGIAAALTLMLGRKRRALRRRSGRRRARPARRTALGATLFLQGAAAGPRTYEVPAPGGVLTSWSVQGSGVALSTLILKVVRPEPGQCVQDRCDQQPGVRSPLESSVLFPIQIPVTGGEQLALWVPAGTSTCYFVSGGVGDVFRYRGGTHPEPAVGAVFPTDVNEPNNRVNVSAVLEPDCDNDGFGDENQDSDLVSCDGTPRPTPRSPAAPRRRRSKSSATFVFSGTDAASSTGFECSLDGAAFAACTSPHTVKVKKGKHTSRCVPSTPTATSTATPATYDWKVRRRRRSSALRRRSARSSRCVLPDRSLELEVRGRCALLEGAERDHVGVAEELADDEAAARLEHARISRSAASWSGISPRTSVGRRRRPSASS